MKKIKLNKESAALVALMVYVLFELFISLSGNSTKNEVQLLDGFITADSKPRYEWSKSGNDWSYMIAMPVTFESKDGKRGMTVKAYVPTEFYCSWETRMLTSFKETYPPGKNRTVFVTLKPDDPRDLLITKASLDPI